MSTVRRHIFRALLVLSPLLTLLVAVWSYDQRGHFAIGGEYGFLFVPFIVYGFMAPMGNGR